MADEQEQSEGNKTRDIPSTPGAARPDNIFGDERLNDEKLQSEPQDESVPYKEEDKSEVQQSDEIKPGENLKEGDVRTPMDAGAAFNVRTNVRAIPSKKA